MVYYRAINHDRKFIAFISPKCGSTTIKAWFGSTLVPPKSIPSHRFERAVTIPEERLHEYNDYQRVLFVRNPLDRLVSFYCQWVVTYPTYWAFAGQRGTYRLDGYSFAEMMRLLKKLAEMGTGFQHHLIPQVSGIEDVHFDHVIRIDDFDSDIRAFNDLFGIPSWQGNAENVTSYAGTDCSPSYDLSPLEIRARGIPAMDCFWNDELREIALELYADDVKLYEDPPWPRDPEYN